VRGLPENRRLSCSATIQGDLVIDVPQDTVINAQVVRKAATDRVIERNPPIQLCYVEVEQPDMHKPLGDLDRLKACAGKDWGWKDLLVAPYLMPAGAENPASQGFGSWGVTAVVHRDMDSSRPFIIALYPGLKNEAYGIACDIGSTTIAMHLVSLLSGRIVASSGTSNPQIRFGEDLMSRVSYVMMNPDGREAMTKAVRDAVNGLIGKVCAEGGVDRTTFSTACSSPIRSCTTCSWASTRPNSARRPFALAVSARCILGARDRHRDQPRRALYCCPASPAMSAQTLRRNAVGRPLPAGQDDAAGRCRHQCRDRAGQPQARRRRLVAHRPGLRGRGNLVRASAPRPARSSACASTRSRWSRATASSASTMVGRGGLRRSRAWRPASPASAARHHRGRGRDVSDRHHLGRRRGRRATGERSPRIMQNGRTFSYLLREGNDRASRASPSRRTTCAPSSWPRPRSMPASSC
jgi:hypothetical protein